MSRDRHSAIAAWFGRLRARFARPASRRAAFAADETVPAGTAAAARAAGPEAMRDPPGEWDAVDESADESFPASDPPPHSRNRPSKSANPAGD